MWCVAELDDEYIRKMEDVLETYEKPYDSAEPVVSTRSPSLCMPTFALRYQLNRDGKRAGTTSMSDAARPMYSALWNRRPAGISHFRLPIGRGWSSPKP
jgi:hypothetical protein